MGRSKNYSQELKSEILDKIRSGQSLSDLARIIHQTSLREW
jgi:transposase-like protein